MFARIVKKELCHYLLDVRFIGVLALSTLISLLSVYAGIRTYSKQSQEYDTVFEKDRSFMKRSIQRNNLWALQSYGYPWNRRPEVLSPLVYGMSGNLGQAVQIHHKRLLAFTGSLFSMDPIHPLFGILDFAFMVKVILSLCVLLLTYDAVCGEKEGGTLRLFASLPVPRSILAFGKLTGSIIAVLVPFGFSFTIALVMLSLSPKVEIGYCELARTIALMGIFGLYLIVFAAFGLWISALTQERLTSFLSLMGLWTIWIFIVPNLALRASQSLEPAGSIYAQEREGNKIRWKLRGEYRAEGARVTERFGRRHGLSVPDGLQSMSKELRRLYEMDHRKSLAMFETEFYPLLRPLMEKRQNQIRRQNHQAQVLAAISPLASVSFASMDLARTGPFQQERLEKELDIYWNYMARYTRQKRSEDEPVLTDFSWFEYQDEETVWQCLSRNTFRILNLALLAIMGFAGAYVAILKYDVR